MNQNKVFHYFDHNATTPICQEVVAALPEIASSWGNASSIHWAGRQPKNLIREARKSIAEAIHVHPLEIVFTSGGSEANSTILKGLFDYYRTAEFVGDENRLRNHFMCSAVEHPSVIKAMLHLQVLGADVDFIPVNRQGQLDLEFFEARLSSRTALVSVMAANNETGTLFPIKELAQKAHAVGALFHTDAVQAFGKIPVDLKEWNVDFASFSGHKFYSLKGTGFFFCKKGMNLTSLVSGGGQERHRRGGTENTLGIAALGIVSKRAPAVALKGLEVAKLRDHLEQRILNEISEVTLTAGESPRVPNTSSLVLKGVDGETLLMSLDIQGYAVSTGAACSSGSPEPSPVLLAMGLSRAEAQNSLRVSLGWDTTLDEVDSFIEVLKNVVQRLRALNQGEGDSYHV